MKMHVNLATRDLESSVAFYSTLLNARPAKQLPGYALFITEHPGLDLALDLDGGAQAGDGQHFGIVVDSAQDVDAQIDRLQNAGYSVDIERASDPEGRRWETHFVHEDTEARDDDDTSCCTTDDAAAAGATCSKS